jgi:hypothetical protein
MWVQELGFLDVNLQDGLPAQDAYPTKTARISSVYGEVSFLLPPLSFSNLILPDATRLVPYGADAPQWS